MAATLDILTLTEAKLALNVSNTDRHDTTLPPIITGLSARLDKLVGPVVQRSVTEFFNGGSDSVIMRTFPLASIVSVTEYNGTVSTSLTEEVIGTEPSDAYYVDRYSYDPTLYGNQIHRRDSGADFRFTRGRGNIRVVATAGRFTDTASVSEHYKIGARLMLINYWRSMLETTAKLEQFDVPYQSFPRYTVPKAVRDHFCLEIQDEEVFIL